MPPVFDASRIAAASARYVKPQTFNPSYGTAGFRAEASLLPSTVFRCGLLTAARAIVVGQSCGIMVTASHNPEHDNGVKIVEPSGEMLTQAWEPLATELAQASQDEEVAKLMQRVIDHHPAATEAGSKGPLVVLVGYDTRPSAASLVAAAKAGIEAMGLQAVDCGQVTTPQLHFQVVAVNTGALSLPSAPSASDAAATGTSSSEGPAGSGAPSLDLYYDTLLGAFEELCAACCPASSAAGPTALPPTATTPLYVDCANGVGAAALSKAAARLSSKGPTGGPASLQLHLINDGAPGHGGLNKGCGADFVQKEKVAPAGFGSVPANARCCSIDGDADRLVYFQLLEGSSAGQAVQRSVALLDGDKIAALSALLVRKLLAGLPEGALGGDSVKVGVVQTAYANGASTAYLRDTLGLEVACTKTGVKHLHEAAHAFDVGIYFEANGHGTVLFKPSLLRRLEQLEASQPAAKQLLALSRLINQAVGDALSCVLLVELALRVEAWEGVAPWQALYTDLPSRQSKLAVKDRAIITTTDAERRVSSPESLQPAIDALVAEYGPQARSFVRPSGTEDIVRVYAEAATQADADALAVRVGQVVWDLAGGVGPRPQ